MNLINMIDLPKIQTQMISSTKNVKIAEPYINETFILNHHFKPSVTDTLICYVETHQMQPNGETFIATSNYGCHINQLMR